jgi:hypothetical protein
MAYSLKRSVSRRRVVAKVRSAPRKLATSATPRRTKQVRQPVLKPLHDHD